MNFALVGAFVLALGAALIAGVLWLAAGGASRTAFDLYLAIEDESVAGLNLNAPVKYNGVDVGKVRDISLDVANPERVRLVFAIQRGTPIKVDTVAVLKTQGLTGIAYFELAGGARDAATLVAKPPEELPQIRTKPSLSARLENVLGHVLTQLDNTSNNLNALLSDTNRAAFSHILADIATLSQTLAARQTTIDRAIVNAGRMMDNGAQASSQLGPVLAQVGRSADSIERLGAEAAKASTSAGQAVVGMGSDLRGLSTAIGSETLPELRGLMAELSVLSATLRRLSEQTERNPASLLTGASPVPNGPGEIANGDAKP